MATALPGTVQANQSPVTLLVDCLAVVSGPVVVIVCLAGDVVACVPVSEETLEGCLPLQINVSHCEHLQGEPHGWASGKTNP